MIREKSVWFLLLAVFVIALSGCADDTKYRVLSVFFDGVPKPGEKPRPGKFRKRRPGTPPSRNGAAPPAARKPEEKEKNADENPPPEPERPAIESLKKWEEVLNALPQSFTGGVDWVEAVKTKVVAPRSAIPGSPPPDSTSTLDNLVQRIDGGGDPPFSLDVEMIPKVPNFNVVFPHSSHTLWLNCSSCHPGIVKQRGGMGLIFAGLYCGKCHGKVAFDPKTACPRCHVKLRPPSLRKAKAGPGASKAAKSSKKKPFGLKGIIRMKRDPKAKVKESQMPVSVFAHWFHRIRFKCSACHPGVFKMKAGANKITMTDIMNGKFCGRCHNGKVAWLVGFENCERCHTKPK